MVSSSLLPKNAGHGDVVMLILQKKKEKNKTPKSCKKQVFVGDFKDIYTSSQIVR